MDQHVAIESLLEWIIFASGKALKIKPIYLKFNGHLSVIIAYLTFKLNKLSLYCCLTEETISLVITLSVEFN